VARKAEERGRLNRSMIKQVPSFFRTRATRPTAEEGGHESSSRKSRKYRGLRLACRGKKKGQGHVNLTGKGKRQIGGQENKCVKGRRLLQQYA